MTDKLEGDEFDKFNGESRSLPHQKLTGFLVLCCFIVTLGPIQFGLNISSLNSVSDIVKEFIKNDTFLFKEFHSRKLMFETAEGYLNGNETRMKNALHEMENMRSRAVECRLTFDFECLKEIEAIRDNRTKMIREKFNMSVEEYLPYIQNFLKEKRELLESNRGKLSDGEKRVDKLVEFVWAILNSLFTVGGMIGALGSKFIMDIFGRKGALLIHNFVSITAAVLALISPYVHSPVCLMISRFLYGMFSGATCSITPTYLTEISPVNLRGRIGVLPQLGITFGILVSQVLGFQQLLGTKSLWNIQLSTPLVLAIVSNAFVFFFPETPAALLRKDPQGAKKALQRFRNSDDVNQELKVMTDELNANKNTQTLSLIQIFKVKDLRWPLILTFVLHIAQQLSGINAIFFYATDIFKSANIAPEHIQYATLSTGVVNFFTTIAVIPLIDRFGRKLLLVVPIFIILVDFCGLTIFLSLKEKSFVFPILAIACVLIFIISFAIGLGPVPFIYTAESFRENARSSAMALAIMVNWTSTLVLTLTFPFLAKIINQYVFLIFSGVMGLVLVILIPKMVESKGKTTEEIISEYN